MKPTIRFPLIAAILLLSSFGWLYKAGKPALYIIGDSTVKNGSGKGADGPWGWGDFMHQYLDTTRLHIENHARGGRSSRTYQTEGLWEGVLAKVKPGDFVFIQFGHNDDGSLNTGRARGTLKGVGEESEEVVMDSTGKREVVHTYGWYLRKYIRDTKAKGGIPVVFSLMPRNIWKDGKIDRTTNEYGKWATEAARAEGTYFVDLHEIVSRHYEALGPEKVKADFFPGDHTHTNEAGARLNAASVVEGLRPLKKCPVNKYVLASARRPGRQ